MPVIEASISDLLNLIGAPLSFDDLVSSLERLKVNFEGEENGNIILEITADRLDLVTIEGLARAVRGILGLEEGIPEYETFDSGFEVKVEREVLPLRPYIACGVVEGVNLSPDAVAELMQAQEKIHATIGRDRRKVSAGLHDASPIVPPIRYSAERKEEVRFVPLRGDYEMTVSQILSETEKGRKYAHLVPGDLIPVLRDSRGKVLSIPPIINSDMTRVTEETRDMFVDVTGPDERAVRKTLRVLVTALAERGGKIGLVRVIRPDGEAVVTPDLRPTPMRVGVDYLNLVAGTDYSGKEIASLLRKMRLGAEPVGEEISVQIPAYRDDFLHPVDLVEELTVAVGYDKLRPALPGYVDTFGARHLRERISRIVRELMIGLGYQEILNYVMTSGDVLFRRMRSPPREVVKVANPVSESYSVLRDTLIPGIVAFLSKNQAEPLPHKVFEVGDVVIPDPAEETRARDERRVAAAYEDTEVGFEDVQSHLFSLTVGLGIEAELTPTDRPWALSGRCASIRSGGREIGIIAEVSPEVLEINRIKNPVGVFELSLEFLLRRRGERERGEARGVEGG